MSRRAELLEQLNELNNTVEFLFTEQIKQGTTFEEIEQIKREQKKLMITTRSEDVAKMFCERTERLWANKHKVMQEEYTYIQHTLDNITSKLKQLCSTYVIE